MSLDHFHARLVELERTDARMHKLATSQERAQASANLVVRREIEAARAAVKKSHEKSLQLSQTIDSLAAL